MSDEEKAQQLNKVRFASIVVFAVAFVGATTAGALTSLFGASGVGTFAILGKLNYWLSLIVAAALCYGFYTWYKSYLAKK